MHEARPFELGKNRIEALSDGIFAIVMALLILEIHVPDLPARRLCSTSISSAASTASASAL
jgi:uncharacterized membrane protein